ncbi:Glutathione reductase [Scheffersomyces spartinae]|uniref:Glutathione reductase n=1 Tax=Scheffersomyces spartinae TaxID=45513 RepID=A0A9P7V7L9_9ASCO|nr:Glutathione reductase [Scheffersomyces spartinae]KAG7192864.1 Glutathione reductase [Scheffersomyces spartinae]
MAPVTVNKKYDYLVIGGGSGGVASARRAASYGASVLLIEARDGHMGGTCVNVGCVPKKVMYYAASMAHKREQLPSYGFPEEAGGSRTKYGEFDWSATKHKRDAYIDRLNRIYERNLNNEGVNWLYGYAKFINSEGDVEVTLTGDQQISWMEKEKDQVFKKNEKFIFKGDKILIATGGTPTIPSDIEGYENGISSDGFFLLENQPKSVAVVGGGYIGVELTGVFQSLGTKVHQIIRGDKLLRAFDELVQDLITDQYINHLGVDLHTESLVTKVEKLADGQKKVYLNTGKELIVDELLWTIGRKSHLNIGLEKIGVELDSKGQVIVDEYQQSTNPNVFSLGDVVGKVELTPVAIAAGRKLSNRLFSGQDVFAQDKLSYELIPSVVFSHPEVGLIGLTEAQARKQYGEENIKIYKSKFNSMYYAMMNSDDLKTPTFYKIIAAGAEEKIVGLHLVGDDSGEILQGFGVAIKMGATKQDFDNCVAIHPTSAEELVTMR